jgi:hypothetical protein
MYKLLIPVVAMVLFGVPTTVFSEDAKSILEAAMAKDVERKTGIEHYVVVRNLMGQRSLQYFERTAITGADGNAYETFRLVPPAELQQRSPSGQPRLTPEQYEQYAQAPELGGDTLSTEMENGLEGVGLPRGLLRSMGSPDAPWASPDPRTMMGGGAAFMRAAGEAQANAGDGRAEAADDRNDMVEFANRAKLMGLENVGGIKAYHLQAADLSMTQRADGQEFTIQTMNLWIDRKKLVPLKLRMEGTAMMNGQARRMFVEQISTDYQDVPTSNMYESYRQVMRMGGILDEVEEQQMAEARIQLAEFDRQLASVPESQRKMMESMMGSQIDMMRTMVSGGAFEVETVVSEILVGR